MTKYDKQHEKNIVAKNLNILLELNDKRQIDLVKDLGMSQSIVSDYLKGKRYPPPDKMQMLADYFNVMKSDIMEEKPIIKDELNLERKEFINMVMKMDDHEFDAVKTIVKSVLEGFGKSLP